MQLITEHQVFISTLYCSSRLSICNHCNLIIVVFTRTMKILTGTMPSNKTRGCSLRFKTFTQAFIKLIWELLSTESQGAMPSNLLSLVSLLLARGCGEHWENVRQTPNHLASVSLRLSLSPIGAGPSVGWLSAPAPLQPSEKQRRRRNNYCRLR